MSAVSQLLASRLPDSQEEETIQSIIHATREDEVCIWYQIPSEPMANSRQIVEAILNGQVSMLEGLVAPTTVLGSLELDLALSELERLFVKVPHLVLLVREAKQDGCSSDAAVKSVSLAQELYNSSGTLTIERTVSNIMKRTPLISTTLSQVPEPTSYDFDSLADFVLATRFFLYRLLLSALIQTICDLKHGDIPFNREEAEAEDIWAARSILRCVEWAFKPESGVQLTMLRMLIPIQLGFGAWHRLAKRQTSSDGPEYLEALRMKAVSIEIANQIDVQWQNRITQAWRLERICDMFAGGELMEWMYNYRSVSGRPMS